MPQPRRPGLSSPRTPTAASSSKVHVAADDAVPQSPLPEPGSVLLCGDLEINIPPKSPQRGETLESPDSISPKKKTVHMPPNRKMPTNWKPPWDFSGPDPKPRELLNGPPPDSMLTVAKVQASVRKALQRVRFMRMRVDKARRVADGAGEQSYQQQVSAQQHAEENPTLVGFESGAAIEETRVMLTLRELGMAAMRSEMNCSDYAWGLEQLHAYLGEYEQRLRVADKTLTARSKRKPPITKQPIDSGGDEELWCIQCTCREANNLVDEARKACNTAVGRAQLNLAKCKYATYQLHTATFLMLKSPVRAQRVVERFAERRQLLREAAKSGELSNSERGDDGGEKVEEARRLGSDAAAGSQETGRAAQLAVGRTGRGARVARNPSAALGVPRGIASNQPSRRAAVGRCGGSMSSCEGRGGDSYARRDDSRSDTTAKGAAMVGAAAVTAAAMDHPKDKDEDLVVALGEEYREEGSAATVTGGHSDAETDGAARESEATPQPELSGHGEAAETGVVTGDGGGAEAFEYEGAEAFENEGEEIHGEEGYDDEEYGEEGYGEEGEEGEEEGYGEEEEDGYEGEEGEEEGYGEEGEEGEEEGYGEEGEEGEEEGYGEDGEDGEDGDEGDEGEEGYAEVEEGVEEEYGEEGDDDGEERGEGHESGEIT